MPFAQEVRMGSKLRIVLFVVAVFIVLILVLPFLIPVNQFRPTIEEKASAALGRNVQIGDLSLALLRGSLSAENLSIGDDPKFSSSPFLTAKSLKVGVELVPLIFSKTLKITGVSIDTPQVTLLHNAAGVWNFSSLGGAAAKAQAKQAPAEKTSNAAADLSISKLELNNGRISIGETGSRKRGSYDNLDITASDVSMVSQFPVTVTADLPQGGKFKLAGTAGPVNQEDTSLTPLDAKLAISALNLALTGFLDSSAGLGGVVDLDGTASTFPKALRLRRAHSMPIWTSRGRRTSSSFRATSACSMAGWLDLIWARKCPPSPRLRGSRREASCKSTNSLRTCACRPKG